MYISILYSLIEASLEECVLSKTWQTRMKLLVIDEAHCISEWGDNFRQEYQQLSELRSFFQTPVMALTGTSTKKVKADITTHLHLQYNVFDEDTDIVYKSPDSLIGPTYLFRF